jgi:dimethylhistidine N-methyltransferase
MMNKLPNRSIQTANRRYCPNSDDLLRERSLRPGKAKQVKIAPSAESRTRPNFTMTMGPVHSLNMQEEVLSGLRAVPKIIPPKYLYDKEGSRLFDQICELTEYYPTRTETFILEQHVEDIMGKVGQDLCIIELGAGACQKGRLLLETGNVSSFYPIDISTEYLKGTAKKVARSFPHVSVHAVAMDFLTSLENLEAILPKNGKRVLFYAGSSIGNFEPPDACLLLNEFHKLLREDDALLIGYDQKKDPDLLRRAYNDSEGITAAFNLNLLARLNRELEADFDLSRFRHVALYDEALGRVEMHLESLFPQKVKIANERVHFDMFERIHTESSYKYTVAEFSVMAGEAGFKPTGVWMDPDEYFAVGLYRKSDSIR